MSTTISKAIRRSSVTAAVRAQSEQNSEPRTSKSGVSEPKENHAEEVATKVAFAVGIIVSAIAFCLYLTHASGGNHSGKGIGYALAIPGVIAGGITYGLLKAILGRRG